jgi:hypothetical protein
MNTAWWWCSRAGHPTHQRRFRRGFYQSCPVHHCKKAAHINHDHYAQQFISSIFRDFVNGHD